MAWLALTHTHPSHPTHTHTTPHTQNSQNLSFVFFFSDYTYPHKDWRSQKLCHLYSCIFGVFGFSCNQNNHDASGAYMWCDQAKSVWSQSNSFFIFLTSCMHPFYSYILQKTPLKLVNWFQRYEQLKDAKNNRKQKTFSALFGSILKSIFPTSDWFCLITSHMYCSLSVKINMRETAHIDAN